jgi:hypothetical protein
MAIDALTEMNLVEVTSVKSILHQGEAQRDDVNYKYVAAWEYKGADINHEVMHKEDCLRQHRS